MKTLHSISITFQDASKQAENLSDSAIELIRIGKQLDEIMTSLRSGWQGDAATQYLSKCENLKSKILRTAEDLNQISRVVQNSARSYYNAEYKAILLAQTQGSAGMGK